MPEFIAITSNLSISAQLSATDMQAVVQAGFKSVINNRPDGEELGQPLSETLKAAAESAGLNYAYQPVNGANIRTQDLASFAELLNTLPQPILAFCRSGARVNKMLVLLSQSA